MYGSGDMFIPKSILKMLLRGIAWYIDDPETYRRYALVHSITAAAAREFRLPKQKEFTIILEKYGYMDTPILPNGVPHGICSDGIDNFSYNTVHLFHYGKYIKFYREYNYSPRIFTYVRFTKNLRITTSYYNNMIENVHITAIFNNASITGFNCDCCNKIHIIRFYSKKYEKIVFLVGECYKPLKFITGDIYVSELFNKYFKSSLRYRVVAYARSLAN